MNFLKQRWLALSALSVLLVGAGGIPILRTAWRSAGDAVQDATPVEWQIANLETVAGDIVPEARRATYAQAEQQVRVAELDRRITTEETKRRNAAEQLARFEQAFSTNDLDVVVEGRVYDREDASQRLRKGLAALKRMDARIAAWKEQRDAAADHAEASEAWADSASGAMADAAVRIERLKAKAALREARQAQSEMSVTGSSVARFNEGVSELEHRLDVDLKALELTDDDPFAVPLDEEPVNVVEAVREYLDAPTTRVAAKK